MYLLFEHQSSPDPWMRFRLLKYCCRIWETDRRHDPESSELRPIVPVVFYQGPRGWTYSTEFADLFPEAIRSWQWVPRFKHELLDQTALEPEAVAGGVKGRITHLLMMAAFNRHVEAALQLTAQLVLSLHAGGNSNEFRQFFVYLMATQDREVIERFRERLQRRGLEQGGEIMTYAQELLAEGEAKGEVKGRIKGQVEVVEGLLKVGVTWEVIEAATGLNDAGFQALKEQLSESRFLVAGNRRFLPRTRFSGSSAGGRACKWGHTCGNSSILNTLKAAVCRPSSWPPARANGLRPGGYLKPLTPLLGVTLLERVVLGLP